MPGIDASRFCCIGLRRSVGHRWSASRIFCARPSLTGVPAAGMTSRPSSSSRRSSVGGSMLRRAPFALNSSGTRPMLTRSGSAVRCLIGS